MANNLDVWAGFTGTIAQDIKVDSSNIVLDAASIAAICGKPATAFPVEMVINNNVVSETVTINGCNNGAVVITRGSNCYNFTAGSKIVFKWTPNNIKNNCPCPENTQVTPPPPETDPLPTPPANLNFLPRQPSGVTPGDYHGMIVNRYGLIQYIPPTGPVVELPACSRCCDG